jgi:hypothetical protein
MSARTGYDLTEYDVQFRGRCPSCDRTQSARRDKQIQRQHKNTKTNEKRNSV